MNHEIRNHFNKIRRTRIERIREYIGRNESRQKKQMKEYKNIRKNILYKSLEILKIIC